MGPQDTFFEFIIREKDKLAEQLLTHIALSLAALFLTVAIGIPLGILITRKKKISGFVLGITGILQTVPSIALLGFMIPLLGIGVKPAIITLILYALLPVVRNTFTGINEVSDTIKEAARGMGMTDRQLLVKVELPLAIPVIFAGVRTAAVITVGIATLAAYIGAGGLGEFIFGGIALNNTNMILAGAIPAALLALLFDFLLTRLQKLKVNRPKPILYFLGGLFLLSSMTYYSAPVFSKRFLAGFSPEFTGRADGLPGIEKKYGLHFHSVVISPSLVYHAAQNKEVDIIDGYSTDGRIKAYNLVVLKDDKKAFPPYFASAIVRNEILEKYPEIKPVIEMINGRINDSIMTALNYQVDYLNLSPALVAKDFLVKQNLWKPERAKNAGKITIGAKIFSEQYILAEMYAALIKGYTNLDVNLKEHLGGTKICFEALKAGQIDMYVEYTGTGLMVILQPPQQTIDKVLANKDSVFNFVNREFQKQYHITWLAPIGFNNTYALLMRKEEAGRLGVSGISDLGKCQNQNSQN